MKIMVSKSGKVTTVKGAGARGITLEHVGDPIVETFNTAPITKKEMKKISKMKDKEKVKHLRKKLAE